MRFNNPPAVETHFRPITSIDALGPSSRTLDIGALVKCADSFDDRPTYGFLRTQHVSSDSITATIDTLYGVTGLTYRYFSYVPFDECPMVLVISETRDLIGVGHLVGYKDKYFTIATLDKNRNWVLTHKVKGSELQFIDEIKMGIVADCTDEET